MKSAIAVNIHDLVLKRVKYAEHKWDWSNLSCNERITWDIIQTYPYKPWKWNELCMNPNITIDIIQDNPEKPWDWKYISANPNITWDIVNAYPEKTWDWYFLKKHLNNTEYDTDDEMLCMRSLSDNVEITWDIVQADPDKPWNWSILSRHESVTWDIVQTNKDKPWNWRQLSANKNMLLSDTDIYKIIRRHTAARSIQKTWKHVNSDPKHPICKRRLLLNEKGTPNYSRKRFLDFSLQSSI